MSAALWRYFLEDDVEAFRQFLANATYTSAGPLKRTVSGNTSASQKITSGELRALASSPTTPLKGGKGSLATQSVPRGRDGKARGSPISLSRGEINARDSFGRTILHHAASSRISTAIEFVKVLLEIPILDLYIQDAENGWTALHRALYFGNIAIAQALMLRDIQDATDYTTGVLHHAGGLVKIKDNESNSPFEVFSLTIAPRSLEAIGHNLGTIDADDDSGNSIDLDEAGLGEVHPRNMVLARISLDGDEVFAFGSNKNLSLGLGDEDDRQYPERVTLKRPDHLLRRFYQEQASTESDLADSHTSALDSSSLPALIRHKQLKVQEVVMSKLHSAILTTDPQANLYICGFGAGGRLGTGDEATRFNYVCVETGGLASRRVVAIALGQDHSIAISATGEVFTWGSNRYGQLGYSLPPSATVNEYPLQLLPRQLFGPTKKEAIVGAAASSIHSVIFTTTALYTFGRNEGQLGLMDADARSLEIQTIPRRVGVSILQVPIEMVSATDRATSILLESHELIVLTHFGFTKVVFQLESFTNYFLQGSFATRCDPAGNFICKVTSGGNTICAMSSFGEVFTIDVPKKVEIASAGVSTTNPSKARNALPQPSKVWAIRKSHMAAKDVAIGQDGTIILCTESGSVWRKEKRAIIKDLASKATGTARRKDYKFVRIPNITRAIAVRSNAFGAFTAVRRDCDVTREQMAVDTPSLWEDLWPLLPFKDYGEVKESSGTEEPQPHFWKPTVLQNSPAHLRRAVLLSKDAEGDLKRIMAKFEPLPESTYNLWITSTVSNLRIPAHSFLIKAKSGVLRQALSKLPSLFYVSVSENVLSVEYGPGDQAQIVFHMADFLTITNLVYYMYTENVIDVWNHTSRMPCSAARFRQVRTELMKFASILELTNLERAIRLMVEPAKCLQLDMQNAFANVDFFSDADVIIELADDHQLPAHSALLCRRCPFFDSLFQGRAGGRWMSGRRPEGGESPEMARVDLKHIDKPVFERVLQHIYADTGAGLFDDVVTKDLDEFLDYVIEVMSVANELMLDRLAQVCQQTLGKFVTTRNICQLVNVAAACSVNELKYVGLEYICLNIEGMLEQRLLEELDDDLLVELDEMVQGNQLAFLPFARSSRADTSLFSRYPGLPDQLEQARQRRIDSMRLRSRLHEDEERSASLNKFRVGSWDHSSMVLPVQKPVRLSPTIGSPAATSPALLQEDASVDLVFEMDEEVDVENDVDGLGLHLGAKAPETDMSSARFSLGGRVDASVATDRQVATSFGTESSSLSRSYLRQTQSSLGSVPKSSLEPSSPFGVSIGSPRPWATTQPVSSQFDLKEIMAEAGSLRRSNLTNSINATRPAPARPGQKLSQKERKRLQQQQSHDQEFLETKSSPSVIQSKAVSGTARSVWQMNQISHKSQTLQKASPASKLAAPSSTPSARPPAKASMTMRQTVAGAQPSTRSQPPPQSHSASSPLLTSNTAFPQIQSIRHTPLPQPPASAGIQGSMADILLQQQSEKLAVREAVARRSLQEIQQEQEFQEWWDSESRRVQDEAQASAATSQYGRGKRARSRGGRHRGKDRDLALRNVAGNPLGTSRGSAELPHRTAQSPSSRGTHAPAVDGSRGRARR